MLSFESGGFEKAGLKLKSKEGFHTQDTAVQYNGLCYPWPPEWLPTTYPPHELIKVAWDLLCSKESHPFEFYFRPVPIGLHILCVHTTWCHKLHRIVDCLVCSYI